MAKVIDVHDLPEQDVKFVEKLVALLREKVRMESPKGQKEEINFAVWPLGVKGRLTREEIYDYL